MSISTSLLEDLLGALPQLRSQMYFKSSLTALSRAMEDQVLAGADQPLVIASFQEERFYRQEAQRYRRIAAQNDQVYVLAAKGGTFVHGSERYETIAFEPTDALSREWHFLVLGKQEANCLICRERYAPLLPASQRQSVLDIAIDPARRFEGIWSSDRYVTSQAAELLLTRIRTYRPELAAKIGRARKRYGITTFLAKAATESAVRQVDANPFTQRLVTHLHASQYKLLKAYRSIAAKERQERLVNAIATAIRQSLDSNEILAIAAQKLGQAFQVCRCLIYRCKPTDATATIQHEYLGLEVDSLAGQSWPLQSNPLFHLAVQTQQRVYADDVQTDERLTALDRQETANGAVQTLVHRWNIASWLMIPVLYQGQLLGMVELHHCGDCSYAWHPNELDVVDAIATQVGVTLIQAEAYTHLEELNQQLEALERTRSNLIAITGHELRTPLSTIQVCLESLASEPDMPLELRQVMLETALSDGERMRKLIQDFLTLSQLESGRVTWHIEPLSMEECVELALSRIRAHQAKTDLPTITTQVSLDLPLVQVDGEWVVEALSKILDNACKFTAPEGEVSISAVPCSRQNGHPMMEITVADTGRGIEPNRLEAIFDRFYQEEGALQRTVGGTGLGLTICRQIVTSLGGEIWAESAGKDQGSQFHFTVPIAETNQGKVAVSSQQNTSNGKSRSASARSNARKTSASKRKRSTKK